jgi:hypothetical protein
VDSIHWLWSSHYAPEINLHFTIPTRVSTPKHPAYMRRVSCIHHHMGYLWNHRIFPQLPAPPTELGSCNLQGLQSPIILLVLYGNLARSHRCGHLRSTSTAAQDIDFTEVAERSVDRDFLHRFFVRPPQRLFGSKLTIMPARVRSPSFALPRSGLLP